MFGQCGGKGITGFLKIQPNFLSSVQKDRVIYHFGPGSVRVVIMKIWGLLGNWNSAIGLSIVTRTRSNAKAGSKAQ